MMHIGSAVRAGLSGFTSAALPDAGTVALGALIGRYPRTVGRLRMSCARADGTVIRHKAARAFQERRLERLCPRRVVPTLGQLPYWQRQWDCSDT
eukprot:6929161-Pyramimonas_sp.AAC.1